MSSEEVELLGMEARPRPCYELWPWLNLVAAILNQGSVLWHFQ